MKFYLQKIFFLFFSIIVSFSQCTVFLPIEYPVPTQNITAPGSDPNLHRVVIFNDSDFWRFGIDNTGTIAVVLGGKGVANLEMGNYVQIFLKQGHYELELLHKDLVDFKSKHVIIVEPGDNFIRIEAGTPGHGVFELETLPPGFSQKFSPQWKE